MNSTLRKRFFEKISQTVPAPTTPVASVSGSPPSFIASNWFPSMQIAFQIKNIPWINQLADLLNTALFYSSNGQISMMSLKNLNFIFGEDKVPSVDLKNLVSFSKMLYNSVFTETGQPYVQALTPQQVKFKIDKLTQSQPLNNLSSVNPIGQLATKISGNLKENIKSILSKIQ